MTLLTILIADDEAPARRKLRTFLEAEAGVGSILEASDGDEAVRLLDEHRPDLVLLDIQMPGKTGFELIQEIGVEQMPPVVFVTAYDEFALQAFAVHAVDYLLKPFDRERFLKTYRRAVEQIRQQKDQASLLEKILGELRLKPAYLERLLISAGKRHVLLPVVEILYFQAEEKYVRIYTSEHKYLHRESLSTLESLLDPAKFARIHRSHIVRLDAIRQLSPRSHGDYWVELINGEKLVLSRRYRAGVFR